VAGRGPTLGHESKFEPLARSGVRAQNPVQPNFTAPHTYLIGRVSSRESGNGGFDRRV
jgi:hypothetical protein